MPRKTRGTKRFVRVHNNSLWQADFKLCDNDWWMISYQDGHSRFATGSVKVWNLTGGNAMLLLGSVVKRYGALRQILTGQGTWFKLARGETSGVGLRCGEFGVVHVCASGVGGYVCKVEVFHKAYQTESHRFKGYWSFIRLLQLYKTARRGYAI